MEKIDITSLQFIGLEQSHVQQLRKLTALSPEMIEDSIKAFAFDLEVNNKTEKINGSPLSYFMGILRKGTPYLPPENYEDPETKIMRQYIEQKERQKAAKEDLERKKFDLDLEEWMETLGEQEIAELIPEPGYRSKDSPFRKGALSLYFRENIWSLNKG